VLYVVGLGEDKPDSLFLAHRDNGSLGLIAPGTPTNTVDGEPAATWARPGDVRQWLLTLGQEV